MKVVTWNVNSVRMRIEQVTSWLRENPCDIVLLQELKCADENFPYEVFDGLNYNVAIYGQPGYNGVAILSKSPIDVISKGIPRFHHKDARYLECQTMGSVVASVYVPNGSSVGSEKFAFKHQFYEQLRGYIAKRIHEEERLIVGGDFNVALKDIDVYAPETLKHKTCFTDSERLALNSFINTGMTDSFRLSSSEQEFSWWDYRGGALQKNHGMRIDYMFLSPPLIKHHKKTWMDKSPRLLEKASDHIPVVLELV